MARMRFQRASAKQNGRSAYFARDSERFELRNRHSCFSYQRWQRSIEWANSEQPLATRCSLKLYLMIVQKNAAHVTPDIHEAQGTGSLTKRILRCSTSATARLPQLSQPRLTIKAEMLGRWLGSGSSTSPAHLQRICVHGCVRICRDCACCLA
eukprot:4112614-Pleurochrysis_carterae.AAC.1